MKRTISFLLCLGILLLFLDLSTGIYYSNRQTLSFDSEHFNNIVTPIVSILALISYVATLRYVIFQNKVILSQNIKPSLDERLNQLIQKAQLIEIESWEGSSRRIYSGINYIQGIRTSFKHLKLNSEYRRDINRLKSYQIISEEEIETRSYRGDLNNILQLFESNQSISEYNGELVDFIEETISSKMINEHKILILKRLKATILFDYLKFFEEMKKVGPSNFSYPNLYTSNSDTTELRELYYTDFNLVYRKFKSSMNSLIQA